MRVRGFVLSAETFLRMSSCILTAVSFDERPFSAFRPGLLLRMTAWFGVFLPQLGRLIRPAPLLWGIVLLHPLAYLKDHTFDLMGTGIGLHHRRELSIGLKKATYAKVF